MTDDQLMTISEIALELRVSRMTVYRLVHRGDVTAIKVGRSFRVRRSNLQEYLEENSSLTGSP